MKCIIKIIFPVLFLLISCSNNEEKITSLNQLDGKRICVLNGSAGDIAARKHFPNSRFDVVQGSADAGLAVKKGKADAFIYDRSVLQNIVNQNPELTILDEKVGDVEFAAAIKKGNIALLERINEAITELRNEGKLDELRSKWLETKYTKVPEYNVVLDKYAPKLRLGTAAMYEPFTFVASGKITGLDIELSSLIAEKLGMSLEITDMVFEALIPALQAGKIDIAVSSFTVTEERKKAISYSEPYIKNDISVLVRK